MPAAADTAPAESLIAAAASEMLAALRDAEAALQHSAPMMDHYPEPQSRHFSALLRVRAAIRRATEG